MQYESIPNWSTDKGIEDYDNQSHGYLWLSAGLQMVNIHSSFDLTLSGISQRGSLFLLIICLCSFYDL